LCLAKTKEADDLRLVFDKKLVMELFLALTERHPKHSLSVRLNSEPQVRWEMSSDYLMVFKPMQKSESWGLYWTYNRVILATMRRDGFLIEPLVKLVTETTIIPVGFIRYKIPEPVITAAVNFNKASFRVIQEYGALSVGAPLMYTTLSGLAVAMSHAATELHVKCVAAAAAQCVTAVATVPAPASVPIVGTKPTMSAATPISLAAASLPLPPLAALPLPPFPPFPPLAKIVTATEARSQSRSAAGRDG